MEVRGRTLFLSGPMSGISHYNVGAFADAHAMLVELGAKSVYDPAIAYLTMEPDRRERMTHVDYMRLCLREIASGAYDALVQIDGWEQSEGARTEAIAAGACGVPCVPIGECE